MFVSCQKYPNKKTPSFTIKSNILYSKDLHLKNLLKIEAVNERYILIKCEENAAKISSMYRNS